MLRLKQQNFIRYELLMSIRKGLRFGDDDDAPINPQQYGSTGFAADRGKSNFEKDVDNLLFDFSRPAPRRPRGGDPNQKPAQTGPAKPTGKPQAPTVPKVNPNQKPKNEQTNKPTDKPAQKPVAQKPKQPEPAPNKPTKKQPQPPKPPVQTHSQDQGGSQQAEVIEQQPKNVKQQDKEDTTVNIDNFTFFNRPAYIRKLKKIAQDFNFVAENSDKHRFIQVLRPSECVRGLVKKFNSPGFVDHEFPPNWTSISKESRNERIQWKSPQQAFKSPVFGKYVDPNDIQPGLLSSPQFLSTLSCLAERQENIKRLIQNQKANPNGFYYVRINVNGIWRYVAVDHNLPEANGKALGARSYADSQSQLWVSLIQKAYAKVYHSYNCFKSSVPREHYLRDLTGYPVRKVQPSDPQFSAIIKQAIGFGWPLMAVPSQKITQLGFNPNYSLSVVKQSSKGFEFRSSWGTIVQRPKVNISKQGVFQLPTNQIKDYISYIAFAEVDPTISSTTIQSKHHQAFYSCYSFKVNNKNPNATISVSQFDRRLFSENLQYSYVPFRLILQKKDVSDDENHSLYVNSGFSFNSRNLDLAVNLTPGKYYLYCVGSWKEKPYDYNITLYANELVGITKINHSHFPNLISQALTQQCLNNGKRSAKGNVDEYILYHEPSNLVLLTALSLVDKAYNHVISLQQLKTQNLVLLNVTKPEQNFAKKFREQNKAYKQSVFNQKTWEVNLLPHEKYTWVFSSDQDYNVNNFKNWGFK